MSTIYYLKTETYERLVDEYELFDTYYDALVFLAVIGYEEDEYVADANTEGDGEINFSSLTDLYRTVVASLAFQHTEDPKSLVNRDLQVEVVAAYAAGGDRALQEAVGSFSTDPTDKIVSYVRSARDDRRQNDQGILNEIVQSFDEDIVGSPD